MTDDEKTIWQDYAACLNADASLFFEKYESGNPTSVGLVDDMCSLCPVAAQCYENGVDTGSIGVRGGVYLQGGSISKKYNSHRTQEEWLRWSLQTGGEIPDFVI